MNKKKFQKIADRVKPWLYRVGGAFSILAFIFTKEIAFIIIMWIQIVGMEVLIQGQQEINVNVNLTEDTTEKNAEIARLKRELASIYSYHETYAKESKETHEIISNAKDCRIRELTDKLKDLQTIEIKGNQRNGKLNEDPEFIKQVEEAILSKISKPKNHLESITIEIGEPAEPTLITQGVDDASPPIGSLERFTDSMDAFRYAAIAAGLTTTTMEPITSELAPEPEEIAEVIQGPEMVIGIDLSDMADVAYEPLPEITPENANELKIATPIEQTEAKYPAKRTKPASPTAFSAEQIERYAEMIKNKAPRKEILGAMMSESKINPGLANNRYYALVNRIKDDKIADHAKSIADKATVLESAPVKISKSAMAELDAMPLYDSIKEFKNACCDNELLKGYNITDLKGPYKSLRPNLTW